MKLRVKNLGMIRDTEIDIRPLTVIIGPNNTSKTYLAYSIYGIWKAFHSFNMGRSIALEHVQIDGDLAEISLGTEDTGVCDDMLAHISEIVAEFPQKLGKFFQDTSGKLFTRTEFSLDASSEIKPTTLRVLKPDWVPLPGPINKSFYRSIGITLAAWFPKPLLFPAERNAFVITYKMLSARRYRLLRDRQRERDPALGEQEDLRYPEPIEDFLDFLSDIELGPEPDPKNPDRKAFGLLADKIETHLHGGQQLRFQSTRLSGKELKLDINDHLSIDLYNASSSIKQIAPLLLYLRFRAKPGDFLIIDEPEMNLHPETQARLLEALAMLVNAGIRILLTTHSPYFMDHLNNLVAGDHSRPAVLKKQAKHLYIQDTQAFLKMDQVSAYVMDGGDLRSLKDPDYGIRWDTLSNVSGDIQQKYFAIRKAEQSSRGKTKA